MKIRVVLATRALSGVLGGLERQLKEISSALCDFDYEVHLIYLSDSSEDTFFELDSRVVQHKIIGVSPDLRANLRMRFQRQKQVLTLLKSIRPNITIAFMTGAYFFICLPSLFLQVPVILAERNSPQIYDVTTASKNKKWIFLSMIFAKRITTQFPRYIRRYPWYLRRRFRVIPNAIPVEIEKLSPNPERSNNNLVYLFAGRFSFQKRVELLIDSFSEFARDKDDVILRIFGSGSNQESLQRRIEGLKADSKIFIYPATKELPKEILKADALCIPSLWEGFPNVLLEALYLGVPGLGFSNCDGVIDLLADGKNGWLADFQEDGSTYVSLLNRSYVDIKHDEISVEDCRESVQAYIPRNVYSAWKELIEENRLSSKR